jgi:hypothetical protein
VLFGGGKDLLFCNEGDYNYGPSFEKKMKAAGLVVHEQRRVHACA